MEMRTIFLYWNRNLIDVSCAGEHLLGDVYFVRHLVLLVSLAVGSRCCFIFGSSCFTVSYSLKPNKNLTNLFVRFQCVWNFALRIFYILICTFMLAFFVVFGPQSFVMS